MKILYTGVVDVGVHRADKIHFVSLAQALHARGHKLTVLAHGRQTPAELAGIEVHLVAKDTRAGGSRLRNDAQLLSSLLHQGQRSAFDVLYQRGLPLANWWARWGSLPAIVEVNGIHVDELRSRGTGQARLLAFALRERLTIQGARQVICVTDGLRRQVIQRYGVHPDRCTVIENGTNTTVFQPLPRQECLAHVGLSAETFNVGFVGAFQAWIDFETVLQVARHLVAQDIPLRLILVGDGPRYSQVAQRSQELGLGQVVSLVGRVSHAMVPAWLNAFDVCLSPSSGVYVKTIGKSSMKLFEYMACGRPVVASALPGESDVVLAAQAGLLYEPGDTATLTSHLARLYRDPELRDAMGCRGRSYVVEHHSWDRVAEQTEAVLRTATQRA